MDLDLPGSSSVPAPLSGSGNSPRSRNMTHPRKRAVTACENCRARKIKCGNERPSCRACVRQGAQCSYDLRVGHSSFDPASLLILDRINEVIRRLDLGGYPPNQIRQQNSTLSESAVGQLQAPPAEAEAQDESATWVLDGLQVPTSFCSTDSVLAWPVFNGQFRTGFLSEELYIADHLSSQNFDDSTYSNNDASILKRVGICEDDIPILIDRFLHLVHVKNPIMESKSIKRYASTVVEHGIGWDARSCVVLLACALGAIAAPFRLTHDRTSHPLSASPAAIDADRDTAEVYYSLARRRLGLLDRGIVSCQCYLLSAIYQMYTMRPLQAWFHFHQASSTYATYLKGQIAIRNRGDLTDRPSERADLRLQQRLYWTCFKSECEIRTELDVSVSEIVTLAYLDMFPSPPSPNSRVELEQEIEDPQIYTPSSSTSLSQSYQSVTYRQAEQQSWFYYLSEIALRRIANRVVHTFYRENHNSWPCMDLHQMVTAAEHLDAQLQIWESTLPAPIQFRDLPSPDDMDELRYMIRARYLDIKSLIYRPFLYRAIHQVDQRPVMSQVVVPLAHKALDPLYELTSTGPVFHRHHGTWLGCRSLTTYALLVLAAKRGDVIPDSVLTENCLPRSQFLHVVQSCLDTLGYWGNSSPDLARAREVIETLRHDILGSCYP